MSDTGMISSPRRVLSPAAADVLRSELRVEYARALRPMYRHASESEFTALVERMVRQAVRHWSDRRATPTAQDDLLRRSPREPHLAAMAGEGVLTSVARRELAHR